VKDECGLQTFFAFKNRHFSFFASFPGMCGKISRSNSALGVMLFERPARGFALRLRYTDAELRALKEACDYIFLTAKKDNV